MRQRSTSSNIRARPSARTGFRQSVVDLIARGFQSDQEIAARRYSWPEGEDFSWESKEHSTMLVRLFQTLDDQNCGLAKHQKN